MRSTKRIGLGVFAVVVSIAVIWIGVPLLQARRSCRVFADFIGHIRRSEWLDAQAMLDTDPNRFRIEEGKTFYGGGDVTDRFVSAEPDFKRTFIYYLRDQGTGDRVFFQASSIADYADLSDGRIVSVKLP